MQFVIELTLRDENGNTIKKEIKSMAYHFHKELLYLTVKQMEETLSDKSKGI